MARKRDVAGQKFGLLTALKPVRRSQKGWVWECQCDCGNKSEVVLYDLTSGNTGSCGCRHHLPCKNLPAITKHGHRPAAGKSPTYRSWTAMKRRCLNPNAHNYAEYGGRGIAVCERWMKFENFLADMGERPPNTSLDRKNGSLGYYKDNCHWATPVEQTNNRKNAVIVELNGNRLPISEAAKIVGLTYSAAINRYRRGQPLI